MSVVPLETGSALAIRANSDRWNDQQVAALRQIGLQSRNGELPPQGDLDIFFHQCQRTGLDPFARQIYMIERWQNGGMKWQIQTGIDGFRLVARRASDRAKQPLGYEETLWCGEDGVWRDVWVSEKPPAAAKVTVLRGDSRYPAVAHYADYVGLTKDGAVTSMWKKGALMLAKCAEALALRKAFPHDLAGIYTAEEMAQADNHTVTATVPKPRQQRPRSLAEAIPADSDPVLSSQQYDHLVGLIRELELGKDEALPYFSQLAGRDVTEIGNLTPEEAQLVIEDLEAAKDAGVKPGTGEVVEAELEPAGGWDDVSVAAVPK